MTKKLKFSLEMKDGFKVRNLEELKENFELEKLIMYLLDGRLLRWLNDRNYNYEAQEISKFDIQDPNIIRSICKIFNIDYRLGSSIDIKKLKDRIEKIKELKQKMYIDDNCNLNNTAFNQLELIDLMKKDIKIVYLADNYFMIPSNIKCIKFIGIGKTFVVFEDELENNIDIDTVKNNLMSNNVILENLEFYYKKDYDKSKEKLVELLAAVGKFFRLPELLDLKQNK